MSEIKHGILRAECQNAWMSEIKNGRLGSYGKV